MLDTERVELDGRSLDLDQVKWVARRRARVELGPGVRERVEASYRFNQETIHSGVPVYGVTTGVGDSVGRRVNVDRAGLLQEALIRANGCGTGPSLPADQTRAVVLARANCLARGHSAVRPVILERMIELLNHDVVPIIPEQGSIGASGDLVPSSYIGAMLMGRRNVLWQGEIVPAAQALESFGFEPVRLEAKEGLAVLNGTCFMTGIAALAVHDAERLARLADVLTAMTCEGLTGISGPFHPFIHEVKPHPGQGRSAGRIRSLLEGSRLARSYQEAIRHGSRIQENYSLRCAPQCIGVLYDTVDWARRWIETEINSANDNPLFDAEARQVHSGGNFSGFYVGLAMDTLKTAVASVADLLDRQMELLVDEKFSGGLPPNLIVALPQDHPDAGIFHGFKAAQIAMSSLVAEALGLCMPMTAFSRSTECHNQDKVSMGAVAARQARNVIEIAERACAIHLLAACQAVELRDADGLGPTRAIYEKVRKVSRFVASDRELEEDIYQVAGLIRSDELLDKVTS
jgi:phenylalanine ammonia-lyase